MLLMMLAAGGKQETGVKNSNALLLTSFAHSLSNTRTLKDQYISISSSSCRYLRNRASSVPMVFNPTTRAFESTTYNRRATPNERACAPSGASIPSPYSRCSSCCISSATCCAFDVRLTLTSEMDRLALLSPTHGESVPTCAACMIARYRGLAAARRVARSCHPVRGGLLFRMLVADGPWILAHTTGAADGR